MSASVSQQQQQQKQPAAATTAEEEALKRNTDCVYFLASPLTCKKGSECEYRHSEYARVNPRDCYFWLNGNCLNPKCGFRHPPLDGLLGNQGVASVGSSAHPSHAVPGPASSAAHAHHNVGKQGVPCVFFQKGMCVKGDRCAFLHIPNPAANKTHQPAETTPATEPQPFKKPLGGLVKCSEGKKFPSANFSKAAKAHVDAGAAPKVQDTGLGDVRAIERYVPQPVGYEPVPQKNAVGVPLFAEVGHSTQLLQTHGPDDNNSFHNGKDADDVLRESSPGFDVLVDSELRDSEYYHGEDQFGRRSQEGRNFVNEYDPDFHAIADADEEVFHDPRGYDSYGHMRAWGQRRTSSERGDHLERRAYSKDERPDCINESDLRYRLSKHRRVNGLRSVVSHEYTPNYSEEQSFMDTCRDTLQESSISSRLQGRIKLPGRVNGTDTHFERGMQGRQIRSQLSTDRHQIPHQGRLRDRIKGRLEDNYGDQDRSFRAPWTRRREMVDERNSQFPAPKSLAELKSEKEESKAQPSLRKRKSLEDHHHPHSQQPEDTFEAPLPLSEILKRKRAVAASIVSGKKDGMPRETKEKENAVAAESKEENGAESKFVAEDKTELGHDELSEPKQILEAETEGMTMEEGAEDDQVYEGDDQNGEYYYYEEGYEEDGEYMYEEGEDEEYVGEEEGEGGDGSRGGDGGENGSAAKIDVMLT